MISQLPKIEAQIREMVSEYEAKTGKTFTVDGKPLLRFMEDEWEIRKAVSLTWILFSGPVDIPSDIFEPVKYLLKIFW